MDTKLPTFLSTWPRRVTVILLFTALVVVGCVAVYEAGPHSFRGTTWGAKHQACDFTVVLATGRAVLAGTDIYEAHNQRGWYFISLPVMALWMAPFAALPSWCAALTWYVLSVLMVLAAVWMCVRIVSRGPPAPTDAFALYLWPVVLAAWPLLTGLAHGQTTMLMLGLLVAAFYCDWKGRDVCGGVCLAGATLVKVFPLLLLAYFVWRKKWSLVTTSLLALALGIWVLPAFVFGWNGNLVYLKKWVARVATPAMGDEQTRTEAPLASTLLDVAKGNNQSLSAVLWRLTGRQEARWVAMLIIGGMALGIILVGRSQRTTDDPLLLGAAIVCAVLASPVSWEHYFMMLLFPLTALVAALRQATDRSLQTALRWCLGVYAVLSLVHVPRSPRFFGPLCWAAMALWVALIIAAARRARPAN